MKTLMTENLPNIPWQEKPSEITTPCWRYDGNPIITNEAVPDTWAIFNSAAVAFGDGFAGVFRVDNNCHKFNLHAGFSVNGLNWDINPQPIQMQYDNPDVGEFLWGYDPRVVKIDDRWYVTWCNQYHGPTIGVAWTKDFKTFHQLENAFLPYNRNGVLFPRKINGNFAMFSRPSDNTHTPFGDIFYSESPDLEFWGRHRWVLGKRRGWESLKTGPGPAPIETSEGWLALTHGVWKSCSGLVYSMGAVLLDRDKPWKVLCRPEPYILAPQKMYEQVGGVPNVIFPCATLCDADTGRIAIYYGAADTCVALAYTQVDELIDWMKANDDPTGR